MYISAQTTYDRSKVKVWERTLEGRVTQYYDSPFFFYIEDKNGEYKDHKGTSLRKLVFDTHDDFFSSKRRLKSQGLKLWESDIGLEYKILSKYYHGQLDGTLNIGFYDIEIDIDKKRGPPDIYNAPYAPINAISLYDSSINRMIVFAVPPNKNIWYDDINSQLLELADVRLFKTEKDLLMNFIDAIYDIDIISGWNSEGFDDIYLFNRLTMVCGEKIANKLSFDDARKPYFKDKMDKFGKSKPTLQISGRQSLDLMLLVRKFEPGERDSDALEFIADEKLPDLPKITYEGTLSDLYRDDFNTFLRYNIRDSEILKGLEDKFGYIKTAILLSHMDTGLLTDVLGTIKLTEMAIINDFHHRLNLIVKDKDIEEDGTTELEKFGGAFVLPPIVGVHDWIATIDVNSLYPSTMRSINISFDTLIGQFTNTHDSYLSVINKSKKHETLVFEDGQVESLTGKEWNELLRELNFSISAFGTVFSLEKQGIIPSLLTDWFSQRKAYKKLAAENEVKYNEVKDSDKKASKKYQEDYRKYNLLQTIFKLKLNSTYGACGNRFFRFYDVRMAESTTKSGREVLFHMTKMVSKNLNGNYEYPNNFVLGGDTDSVFFKTLQNNYEDCSFKGKEIAKQINESFNDFSISNFLLNDQFIGMFAVSQEIISDKAIITEGKKNYMMHVVERDGIRTDKMKITGLAIKKTTTPRPIRKMLTSHFERYLKGESWKSVGLSLLEHREPLLKGDFDIDSLCLPGRVNKLEEYTQVYERKEKKTVPGRCKAAIFWNKCLEKYEDMESLKIVSGMKVNSFYLKKPIGDFKSIAVPVDLEKLPDWFQTDIIPKIDKEQQVIRLIDQVCKPLLIAMNEMIPTRKTLLVDELVDFG